MSSKGKGRKKQQKSIQQPIQRPRGSSSKVVIHEQTLEGRRGPIPSPDDLERYDSIIPNGADRIMALAESQTAHRHKIEQDIVDAQVDDAKSDRTERLVGQVFALIIGLAAIGSGAFVAIKGHAWPGALLGGSAIVGLVSVFIAGRKNEQHEKDSD